MHPGDVIRARAPNGLLLEVTVPVGALVGDLVQFALPDEEPGVVGAPRSAAAVVAKLKTEARINVRDVDQGGISNTRPKRIFKVRLPASAVPGAPLLVELPGGECVTVAVPCSAKPGCELSFCAGNAVRKQPHVEVRIM